MVAWFQMLNTLIMVRIQIFFMWSSAHLHKWYADARGHSTSGETRTSLNLLKNVLSCVNRSYHLPLRLQRNTRKRTSITQWLVNSRKYTSSPNPSMGKTPLVFFNSSTCIAIAKSLRKMHVTIFHVGKHKRHVSNLPTIHSQRSQNLHCIHTEGSTCAVQWLEWADLQ